MEISVSFSSKDLTGACAKVGDDGVNIANSFHSVDPEEGLGLDRGVLLGRPWHLGCQDYKYYPPLTRYIPAKTFTWTEDLGSTDQPQPPEPTTSDVHTTEISTIFVSPTTTETKTVTSTDTFTSTFTSTTIGGTTNRDPLKKIVTVTVAPTTH